MDAAWPWYRDPVTVVLVDGPGAPAYARDRVAAMYDALGAQGEVYVVALRSGAGWEPVGDVALAPHTLPIVVAPGSRGRGIGRRVLEVRDDNEASHRLFSGLVVVSAGTVRDHGPSRGYVLRLAPLGGRPRL